MDLFNDIKNNSIIICSNSYKIQILKNIKKIVNVKFFSMNEFIKNLYFDVDYKTILYIINKYNLKYEIVLEYINNLYYIEDKKYNNEKLDFLVNLKNELIKNNLLIFNNNFKKYIKDKDIIVYKYDLSKFEKYLLSNLSNVKIIEKDSNNYIPNVYEFNTIEDEVEYVAYEISKLINNNIPISNIKLTNVNRDYINVITKIFSFYNLKINKFNNIPIISNIVGKTFYDNLDKGINQAIDSIKDYNTLDTYNKIIDICNKYIWCEDINDLKTLITYDLNNTFIDNTKYTNMIDVVDFKNYNFNDEYVFMLGFNQGIIPIIYKDEDYINDSIKPIYLDNTIDKNNKERIDTLKSIKNIKNLTITYKLKTSFNAYYPSSLIDDLNIEVKRASIDLNNSYSDISNKLKLGMSIDNLIKFGKNDNNLEILISNYDIPYNTYSNNFTGLSKIKLNNYINNLKQFNLSYSYMDNYNRCAFRFYIDKILCLKKDLDRFSITLGNIYHDVLEKYFTKNINIKEEVYNFLDKEEIVLTNSNKFFVERAIKDLEFLVEIIKKQNNFSKLNNIETEKFIKINLRKNINFVGFIDKILTNNKHTIGTIIDYKTYIKKPSLKYINSGINLQLPTYMYLAKQEFKNIRFAGFYLQNITLDNKSNEEKEKSLKLIGYTNTDKKVLEEFDYSYKDSSVIDGIKINKDGSFSSNSMKKMLNDEEIENIIKETKNQINKTIDNILDSKFDINPKYDKENLGCEFCQYKDLCFMSESNFEYIKPNEIYDEE